MASIRLWRAVGDRYYEAETTVRLGEDHLAAGNATAAGPAATPNLEAFVKPF